MPFHTRGEKISDRIPYGMLLALCGPTTTQVMWVPFTDESLSFYRNLRANYAHITPTMAVEHFSLHTADAYCQPFKLIRDSLPITLAALEIVYVEHVKHMPELPTLPRSFDMSVRVNYGGSLGWKTQAMRDQRSGREVVTFSTRAQHFDWKDGWPAPPPGEPYVIWEGEDGT